MRKTMQMRVEANTRLRLRDKSDSVTKYTRVTKGPVQMAAEGNIKREES